MQELIVNPGTMKMTKGQAKGAKGDVRETPNTASLHSAVNGHGFGPTDEPRGSLAVDAAGQMASEPTSDFCNVMATKW